MDIKELDVVRLKNGQTATILGRFDNGAAFWVEVIDETGKTLDMPFVTADDILELIWKA